MSAHARPKNSRLRSRPRRAAWRPVAIGAALVAGALLVPSSAVASHFEASLEGSQFEIDNNANLRNDSAGSYDDWVDVDEDRKEDLLTGRDDDSYAGGAKEDDTCPGTTTGSIPNNKSDLLDFGVYEEPGAPGHPGYLNVFWTRVQEPSGTTLMDFEFNQSATDCGNGVNKVRTDGDLLLEYRIEQGGATAQILVREWTGTAWGTAQDLTADGSATGTINNSAIPDAESDGLGALSARTFGEATLDLSAVFDPNECTSFGSAFLKSRASDSFTSQLKDFIKPASVSIGNCGTVTVVKETDPAGDPGPFSFSAPGLTPETFDLADDGQQVFTNVLAGGYTISETDLPAGWTLEDIECDGGSPQYDLENGQVTITVAPDSDITCTFSNEGRGNIIVDKVTDPAGSTQSFDFTPSWGDPFSLTDEATPVDSGSIPAGTYSVTESPVDGWDQTAATCSDGSSPDAIDLDAGETVTCTFTNVQRGQIVVVKETDPASADLFAFTSDYGPDFSLSDGQSNTSELLEPGTYSVNETVPEGWDLSGTSCDDGSPVSAIALGAGEIVTCTFTNTQDGKIVVVKQTDPDGATQSFDFTASYSVDGFSLADGESNDSGFLPPKQTYSVTETVPDGWDLTDAACVGDDDGGDPASIQLDPGEVVTCTFTNTQRGTIVVVKQTDPDGSMQSFGFTASYDADGFSLTDGQSNDSGFLVPGSYTVAETVPTGWDLTDAVCDDGSSPSGISLDPGETVTCTFTNTQRGTITVVKQTDPDGSTQLFEFTSSYGDPFQLVDGQSESSGPLEPGIYSVSETPLAGWDLTSATCDDGSSPDSIALASGESVTCTFENRQRGAITIVKTDDAGAVMEGVTFTLYADLFPFGGSPGQEDIDPGAVGSCVTDAAGTCTVGNLVPDVSYWVVETPLEGYVEPDPVVELVEPGDTVTVNRVNVREFQIITFVCRTADQTLYASTANGEATQVEVPEDLADLGVTEADLCALVANLGGKTAGSHDVTVNIPQ